MDKSNVRNFPLEDIDRESLFHPMTPIAGHLASGPMLGAGERGIRVRDMDGRVI